MGLGGARRDDERGLWSGAGLTAALDKGCEERGWSKEDPNLAFWSGSWLLGGALSNGGQ